MQAALVVTMTAETEQFGEMNPRSAREYEGPFSSGRFSDILVEEREECLDVRWRSDTGHRPRVQQYPPVQHEHSSGVFYGAQPNLPAVVTRYWGPN